MVPAAESNPEHAEKIRPRLRFRPAQRLKSGADFRRVFARRCSAREGDLQLFGDALLVHDARANADRATKSADRPGFTRAALTRLGLSVGKKKVGSAVQRNRWKRLLREAFRLQQAKLPTGMDLVAVPQSPQPPPLAELQAMLTRLAWRIKKRLGLGSN